MRKKYLGMLAIGITLCALACVNLLLKNFDIVTLVQILFGVPFVIVGIKNAKDKTD